MSLRTADGSKFKVDRDQLADAARDTDDELAALALRTLYRHRYGEEPS